MNRLNERLMLLLGIVLISSVLFSQYSFSNVRSDNNADHILHQANWGGGGGSWTGRSEKRIQQRKYVKAIINLSSQRMRLYLNNHLVAEWDVSSGARGYRTPTGKYRPVRMHRHWYSRKYDNAPMPYSIFFYRGYAIHGTDNLRSLGRPASHGCIRLHPRNAKVFYNIVRRYGMGRTRIIIRY